jgi:hypothetical protein
VNFNALPTAAHIHQPRGTSLFISTVKFSILMIRVNLKIIEG